MWQNGKVIEFDPEGKQIWEGSVNNPVSARRLLNGNTLAVSMGTNKVVELDRNGKQVWEHKADGRPWGARRR
jgi:outer membrane protein assembly factor BamB